MERFWVCENDDEYWVCDSARDDYIVLFCSDYHEAEVEAKERNEEYSDD
jgi:hypothetical protein